MLTFNLKKEWFEKIKSGEKTHEYRVFNPYWGKRLGKPMFNLLCFEKPIKCCFALGYPKKEDETKRIYANLKKISVIPSGLFTDLKTTDPVFDIEFELIEEELCQNSDTTKEV